MAAPLSHTKLARYKADPDRMTTDTHYPIYQEGYNRGYTKAMAVAISCLEEDFMGDEGPVKGTPEYDIFLTITRRLADKLRNQR